jgi:hypothetical protein
LGIKVSAYSITIGNQRSLSIAQGEDREFRLTFSDSSGARDLTGATAITLTVRSRVTGIEIFSRLYSGFQGAATAGTPRFQVVAADTANQADGPHDCWVEWTDASGYVEQLLVESTFEILTGADPESVTSPPGVSVVYGLNWYTGYTGSWWTALTGGYQPNDAVIAYDGSLGATAVSSFRCIASGVTYFPVNSSLIVSSGWQYVGQHGGAGSAGPTGPVGATGAGANVGNWSFTGNAADLSSAGLMQLGISGATGIALVTPQMLWVVSGVSGAWTRDSSSGIKWVPAANFPISIRADDELGLIHVERGLVKAQVQGGSERIQLQNGEVDIFAGSQNCIVALGSNNRFYGGGNERMRLTASGVGFFDKVGSPTLQPFVTVGDVTGIHGALVALGLIR